MKEEREYTSLKKYISSKGLESYYYRDSYLKRRLHIRMRENNTYRYGEYLKIISGDPEEYNQLAECLSVNFTGFFRDFSTYEYFKDNVLPELADKKMRDGLKTVRIWSAACSSGEEPYSIVMSSVESSSAGMYGSPDIRIYATDIDKDALAFARKGIYPEMSVSKVSDVMKKRYFDKCEGSYKIKDSIRGKVVFKAADIIREPAPQNMDVVFCRNMLIYIDVRKQVDILNKFHDALVPGGYLFLGRTEGLYGMHQDLFRAVNTSERVYKKL